MGHRSLFRQISGPLQSVRAKARRRFLESQGFSVESLETRQLLTVTANPDIYVALQDTTLSVAAPGILGNDNTNTGTPLTVTGFTQPTKGQLTLNPNGSFQYIPTAGTTGADQFSYTVADTKGGTSTSTVQFAVSATTDEASVFAGPRLASVSSTQGTLLNGVLGGLIGTNLNLTVADYNGLAAGSVNGGRLADALGVELGVTPDQALTTNATLAQILTAAASVAQADGNTAEVTALNNLAVTVGGLTAPVQLGNLLQVNPNDGSLANTDINALDLVTGTVQLFNFDNVVTTPTPVTISAASLGLPGIVGQVQISAQVVEPPVLTTGPAGTQFHSAAIRTRIDVNLIDSLNTGALNTALAALGFAANASLGNLSIYSEIAEGQGTIASVNAIAQTVTLQATPGLANVYVGSIADNLFFDRTHVIDPTTDVGYGNVGTLALTNALTPALNVSTGIQLRAVALGIAPTASTEVFNAPFPQSMTVGSSSTAVTNLVNSLVTTLDVRLAGSLGALLDPLVNGTILPIVKPLVTNDVTPLLAPVLSNVVDPTLKLLGTGIGELDLTVNAVSRVAAPGANPDFAVTQLNQPVTVAVLDNDATLVGDPITVTAVTQPTNGTVVINSDGTVTYTPTTGYVGPDTFTYTITDTKGLTSTGTVTIKVLPLPPVANPDTYTANQNTPLTVAAATGVLANDTDPAGSPLTAVIDSNPTKGTLTLNPDGSFTYTPTTGTSGPDSFTYRATDGTVFSNPVIVTVNVQPALPVAVADTYTAVIGTPLIVPVVTGVLANDTDPNGLTLTAGAITQPTNGTLTLNPDGSLTYTPNAGFLGTDSFTYQATDANGSSAPATVTVNVQAAGLPVANPDVYVATIGTPLNIPVATGVLANDTDPNGLTLSAVVATMPTNGTLTLNPDGSLTYTPNAGFLGTDSFTYRATDTSGQSSPAMVTINVQAAGLPVANPDTYTATIGTPLVVPIATGVLANDTDPNGLTLSAVVASQPTHGTLILNPDGSLTYTPTVGFLGADSFTYRATDASGQSVPTTVAINVQAAGTPVANPDVYTLTSGTTLTLNASTGVLANDTDPNGLTLSAVVATMPTNGTLTLNPDGSLTYTPTAGFVGTDSFTYRATDSSGQSAPTLVSLIVSAGDNGGGGTQTQPPQVVTTFPVTGTVGVPIDDAPVVTFTDGDGSTPPGSYTATIDWGDGTAPSTGTVTETNGVYQVTGDHTYQQAGTFPVGVTITRPGSVGLSATTAAVISPVSSNASLSGVVFSDTNGDGIREAGEAGVANAIIILAGSSTTGQLIYYVTLTALDGSYSFSGLPAGTYAIAEQKPGGTLTAMATTTISGQPTVGTLGGMASNRLITNINVTSGAAGTGYNFAESASSSLSGNVYLDANRNRIDDGNEYGVSGVVVTLSGTTTSGQQILMTTTTDVNGNYQFSGLDSGIYQVHVARPSQFFNRGAVTPGTAGGIARGDSITSIQFASGTNATGYNFGELARPNCRLNGPMLQALLRVGPTGALPANFQPIRPAVGGAIRRFFPVLANRADGQAGVATQQIHQANVHAQAVRAAKVHVQHGKALPKMAARRHK